MKYAITLYMLGLLIGGLIIAGVGCKDDNSRYMDLNTGNDLTLVKDASTGLMVDADSKRPVYIYVDKEKNDTIYGSTGKVINGEVTEENGKYVYADYKVKADTKGEYKIKGDDYKEKMEKDGDLKIKNGDTKIKVDGKTGEVKRKD